MKKILALVLAAMMLLGCSAVAEDAGAVSPRPVDVDNYATESEEIYMNILGDFYAEYQKALEATNVSERYALMAVAEAKMLESGIFIPCTSKGGNYAIGRVAPYTVTSVLWGNDSDRFHQALIVNEDPLTSEQRAEMKAKWAELVGTGTYEAWAKQYLADNGYTLNTTYNMTYNSDPQTWDGLATSKAADSEAIVNTFDGLYEYDIENVPQPALATEYTVSEDGLVYTFTLREGVKWVDSQGREVADLKADDFVAGMQHMMDAAGGLEYLVGVEGCGIVNADEYVAGEVADFAEVGVKATDDLHVEYTLAAPCPFFTTMLSYNVFAPMSREYFLSQGGAFGADYDPSAESYVYGKDPDHIAYCGPYLVTNLTPENTIVFSANPAYWNAEAINLKEIVWKFNDGQDATKAYKDMVANEIAGAGLNAQALELARGDGNFDKFGYVSLTDATSYMGFVNVNRHQFVNFNDETTAPSAQTAEDAARTHAAMQNKHFRAALVMSLDRATYNAQSVGEDLKYNSLINSYTPGTFVTMAEDVTIDINGTATEFKAGTFYGQIMQAQLVADGSALKVWDDTEVTSTGFDGWYNPEAAKAELAIAIEELAAEGIEISAENPILLDLPAYTGSEVYDNRSEVFKRSVADVTDNMIVINKIPCASASDWYYAGYYPEVGYQMNADMMDVSGWGPDYGDPQTYLNTMMPFGSGYMVKSLGLF